MNYPRKIDLHMHTSVSDGTDSPAQIVNKVKEAGIDLFSVTDHDAVKGCEAILPLLKEDDPQFLTGAEFSCKDEHGQYHILGYGYDPLSPFIRVVVEKGHALRMGKLQKRLDFLSDRFGFTFSEEDKAALFALDNPGKPHLGNLMVKYGYAPTKEKAIDDYINQFRAGRAYIRPEEAIRGIADAGGIPVLAHPVYGRGDELILGDELDQRLKRLIAFGLAGVEGFYSGFTPKMQEEVLALARKYHLYVTAGSDYHGQNKMVSLGDTGLADGSDYPEGLRRFLNDAPRRGTGRKE